MDISQLNLSQLSADDIAHLNWVIGWQNTAQALITVAAAFGIIAVALIVYIHRDN